MGQEVGGSGCDHFVVGGAVMGKIGYNRWYGQVWVDHFGVAWGSDHAVDEVAIGDRRGHPFFTVELGQVEELEEETKEIYGWENGDE